MYFSYGFPKSLLTGAAGADSEAIYAAASPAGDLLVVVFNATIQVWSGGQHRVKLGELHRSREAVEEEGPNLRAHWCPQKRVLAVATAHNHLQLYGLNVSSEALWRLPDGQDVRRVNLYLSHSLHLDYGPVRLADLGGDAKSLLVALSNGTMQVFSWQGKLRGQANPFIAAYEGSRSRLQQRSRSQHLGGMGRYSSGVLGQAPSGDALAGAAGAAGAAAAAAAANGLQAAQAAAAAGEAGGGAAAASSALLAAMAAMDLPQPTPALPAEVQVERCHYAPAARMLAVVLADGRAALCRTAAGGIHPVEQLQLFRWVYKPAAPGAPAAVAAALNPPAQLLALGLSHGRVAIYTMQSLLSTGRHPGSAHLAPAPHQRTGSGQLASFGSIGPGGGGAGQPEPVRVLSLADWGYRSSTVGAATQLQWSPDGRVLAVGYAERGMAVWTPSGCRLMCSLRQAVATSAPGASSIAALVGASASAQLAAPSPTPPAPELGADADAAARDRRSSAEGGWAAPGSGGGGGGGGGLWSQSSMLNPSKAPEPGVLEGGITCLAWTAHGYQLLVGEAGGAAALHQLEFARQMHGAHRVAQSGLAPGAAGGGDEVQALQAADRLLLISESPPTADPTLTPPPAPPGAGAGDAAEAEAAAAARPDLVLQHVRLPQQYIEAAYPLLHAAISQDRQAVAAAGACGLAVYSRRQRRWRLFGDATQERSIKVQGLAWLPGGVVAVVALAAGAGGRGGAEAPQLLLYPHDHLDSASLLARLPLQQVPVALDSAGWHLLLAFAPLELKLLKVTLEAAGPGGRPSARLSVVRELSILGLGSPLQEIALIDPLTLPHNGSPAGHPSLDRPADAAPTGALPPGGSAPGSQAGSRQGSQAATPTAPTGGDPTLPQLPPVATRPRAPPAGAEAVGVQVPGDAPLQCVLLRAGGIMSKLDMQEGSEVLLSDAIERFWLPLSPEAAGLSSRGGAAGGGTATGSASGSAGVSRASSFAGPLPPGAAGGLSASSSMAGLGGLAGRASSDADADISAAASRLATEGSEATLGGEAGGGGAGAGAGGAGGQAPHVEMPWWTYGARGMQLWFPSSLSEPLTPSLRGVASPTATGLAAAAAAAATNSTDPELEFDREVYPIGVSLAEVSIIGVMQRTVRSQAFPPTAAQSLCLHPLPESQPVLPCLLRRLLQKGRFDDALELARWHSSGPHFNRSLEWLLFTALEIDADTRPASSAAAAAAASSAAPQAAVPPPPVPPPMGSPRQGGKAARQARFNSSYAVTVGALSGHSPTAAAAGSGDHSGAGGGGEQHHGLVSPRSVGALSEAALAQRRAGPLLVAAARLIACFPQFPEIVVSVARKTDAALWPALFAAVGSPERLCLGLMQADKLQSAACCLVIVEQIEGSAPAQQAALLLIRAALQGGQYGLAADLLRFLVPPGEAGAELSPGAVVEAVAAAAAPPAAAGGEPQQQQAAEGAAAGEQQAQQPAAAAAAAPPPPQRAPQQQQQRQQQAGGSWFWSLLGYGEPGTPGTPAAESLAEAAAAGRQAAAQEQQAAVAAAQQRQEAEEEADMVAAGEAWRLTAQHAWKLLDSGALREAAQLARSLAEMHGGLPVLLAATAAETPAASAHLAPSAAAIASALFVAANEFTPDAEMESALAAEQLLQVCQEAGCVNLAAALALLLGDQPALQLFADQHPAVWDELHGLIANDVHLCGFAPVLSPLPSPMVAGPAQLDSGLLGGVGGGLLGSGGGAAAAVQPQAV